MFFVENKSADIADDRPSHKEKMLDKHKVTK